MEFVRRPRFSSVLRRLKSEVPHWSTYRFLARICLAALVEAVASVVV